MGYGEGAGFANSGSMTSRISGNVELRLTTAAGSRATLECPNIYASLRRPVEFPAGRSNKKWDFLAGHVAFDVTDAGRFRERQNYYRERGAQEHDSGVTARPTQPVASSLPR
jgi:hypothetical protein